MTNPNEASEAFTKEPGPTGPKMLEPINEEQKTLQNHQTDSQAYEYTQTDPSMLLIESTQERERLLHKRTYQLIEKLAEFLQFLAFLNDSEIRHGKSDITSYCSHTSISPSTRPLSCFLLRLRASIDIDFTLPCTHLREPRVRRRNVRNCAVCLSRQVA